jgi:hypothetical protein
MTQPQDAANDLLMGGGIKSIAWKDNPVGYTVVGTIVDQPKAVQMTKWKAPGDQSPPELDFWPSGDAKMEIVVTIQTDLRDPANTLDDGKRKLHISPRMMPPVRDAVKRAGAPGLAMGGRIAVQRSGGTGETGSPFEFAADYAAPVVDPGSLLGPNGNGAATPAAQPAQQAAAVRARLRPAAALRPASGSTAAGTDAATGICPRHPGHPGEHCPAAARRRPQAVSGRPARRPAPGRPRRHGACSGRLLTAQFGPCPTSPGQGPAQTPPTHRDM